MQSSSSPSLPPPCVEYFFFFFFSNHIFILLFFFPLELSLPLPISAPQIPLSIALLFFFYDPIPPHPTLPQRCVAENHPPQGPPTPPLSPMKNPRPSFGVLPNSDGDIAGPHSVLDSSEDFEAAATEHVGPLLVALLEDHDSEVRVELFL